MKNLFIILLLIVANIATAQIPNNFKYTEDVISIGTNFSSDCNLTVKQTVPSFKTVFTLYNNGNKVAKASQRLVTFGTKIDVYDANDNKIGTIEERLFTSIGFYSLYKIYDKNGNLIATSEKHKYFTTKFYINDSKNKTICTISRPAINPVRDTWTVNFNDPSVDKRLLVFIPCYKTYYDNNNN